MLRKIIREMKLWTSCFAVLALAVLLFGCGGGSDKAKKTGEDNANIDQLLGVEGEQKTEKSEPTPEDAEVLRLLGIQPEAGGTKEAAADTVQKKPETLEQQVQRLQTEIQNRDQTISQLQNELQAKEKEIYSLQASQAQGAAATFAAGSQAARGSGSYSDRYQYALSLYQSRKYRDAIQVFSSLLAEDSNNKLADNCQYWIGECYYSMGNYTQAVAEFEKVFAYSKSNKADDALLKLGLTYLKLGDRVSAKTQFQQLISSYPNSEYVSKARSYMSKL